MLTAAYMGEAPKVILLGHHTRHRLNLVAVKKTMTFNQICTKS
jgi:hypothetical protein